MSEMADQDFQDLFSYLQPQSLTEDPGFIDSSMDGGFPEDILDTQESHSARSRSIDTHVKQSVADIS